MRFGRKRLTQICGAIKKNGEPCRYKMIFKNGRCKYHGGMCTGPKTPEGKAKCTLNLPWNRKKNNPVGTLSEGPVSQS